MASVNIGVSAASIFLAYLPLPHPPKLTGADSFQLLEHAAKIVQLSDAAFQTDLLDAFVGKPQHPFRMGDPQSDQRHTKAVCKVPNIITTQVMRLSRLYRVSLKLSFSVSGSRPG